MTFLLITLRRWFSAADHFVDGFLLGDLSIDGNIVDSTSVDGRWIDDTTVDTAIDYSSAFKRSFPVTQP